MHELRVLPDIQEHVESEQDPCLRHGWPSRSRQCCGRLHLEGMESVLLVSNSTSLGSLSAVPET